MYTDLMDMHKQAMEVMEERGVALRSKLKQEKDYLIEEEKKLSGNEFSLKNDKEQLDLRKKNEKRELESGIAEQEKKISELERALSSITNELETHDETVGAGSSLELNKERASQKRLLDAERARLEKIDKEEDESRAENLRNLQTVISEKSVQLLQLKEGANGTKFANPLYQQEASSNVNNAGSSGGDIKSNMSIGKETPDTTTAKKPKKKWKLFG